MKVQLKSQHKETWTETEGWRGGLLGGKRWGAGGKGLLKVTSMRQENDPGKQDLKAQCVKSSSV